MTVGDDRVTNGEEIRLELDVHVGEHAVINQRLNVVRHGRVPSVGGLTRRVSTSATQRRWDCLAGYETVTRVPVISTSAAPSVGPTSRSGAHLWQYSLAMSQRLASANR